MTAEPWRILVADDDDDIRELACMRLELAGYNVVQCQDGKTALRMIREQHPDACVLDIHMPGMQGHEVLQAMRDDRSTEEIPVVLVTATMDVRSLWRLGPRPDDCLRKSSLEQLEQRIGLLLERRHPTEAV